MFAKLDEFGGIPCSKSTNPEEWHEIGANAFTEPYGFTGKEYEKDLGITYFGARFYNPQTTRWLSPDPLYLVRTAKNAEKDQNVYCYASNNPWKFVDPDGNHPEDAINRKTYYNILHLNSNQVAATTSLIKPILGIPKYVYKAGVKIGIYSKPGQKPTKAESLAVGFFAGLFSGLPFVMSIIVPSVIPKKTQRKIKGFLKKNRNAHSSLYKGSKIFSHVVVAIFSGKVIFNYFKTVANKKTELKSATNAIIDRVTVVKARSNINISIIKSMDNIKGTIVGISLMFMDFGYSIANLIKEMSNDKRINQREKKSIIIPNSHQYNRKKVLKMVI